MEGIQNGSDAFSTVMKGSFKEIVANSTHWFQQAKAIYLNSMDWEDPEIEVPKGDNVVLFSRDKIQQLRKPWSLTLMGKCLGIFIRPSFMTRKIRSLWKPKGAVEVIDLGKGVYLYRFSLQDDYEKALFGGPWYILDHYLMINRWQPNYRPTENHFDKLAVWVHFPELPVEYYDKEALYLIASKVGKPIRVDYATNNLSRARYARVFVEVNLDIPILTKVWVGNCWQTVLYENLHLLCFQCGRIGHQKSQCSEWKEGNKMELGGAAEVQNGADTDGKNDKQVSSGNVTHGIQHAESILTVGKDIVASNGLIDKGCSDNLSDSYGPWTTVLHKKKTVNSSLAHQSRFNKGKAPINYSSSLPSGSRKPKYNHMNSNAPSTSNY
ncbi:uncharacterized protein LOC130591332 [Beta vulgaris subsp. vulgaris]|uniref:uncharacterized protein LOC130591332 n=1 Tax=Beta vulgaris subsp. vulgaris TaxID=3555 RepID=UPI0025478D73|nr:uncharacterized protein LOC130591332 [Beta vulgaris subsp. vulgaris]